MYIRACGCAPHYVKSLISFSRPAASVTLRKISLFLSPLTGVESSQPLSPFWGDRALKKVLVKGCLYSGDGWNETKKLTYKSWRGWGID